MRNEIRGAALAIAVSGGCYSGVAIEANALADAEIENEEATGVDRDDGIGEDSSGPRSPEQGGGQNGDDGDWTDLEPEPTPGGAACEDAVSPSLMRRLTKVEYALTLQELLALDSPPDVSSVPNDPNEHGFRTFAQLNTTSSQHLRAYADIASRLAEELMASPRRDLVVGCDPQLATCLTDFVRRFGRLAFRHSLSNDELESIASAAQEASSEPDARVQFALEVMLTSPSFVFRAEGSGSSGELVPLSSAELASRLSFAVWGRGPTESLLDLADAGALENPDDYAEVVSEMLSDPRSGEFYRRFFEQWLGFEALRSPVIVHEGWDDSYLEAMREQTHAVLYDYAWTERAFFDVLLANESPVSSDLAVFLGMEYDAALGVARPPYGDPREDAGILTHPSILALKSDGDLISKRGAWIQNTFLCRSFEVPPGLFENLGDELVGLSYAEIVVKRNEEEACRGCHFNIDPPGITLSMFDEDGILVPSPDLITYGLTPGLPGIIPEAGRPADIAAALRDSTVIYDCLTKRAFLYTQGFDPSGTADQCMAESAFEQFESTGRFRDLLSGLVTHEQFRWRRNPS